MKITNEGEAMNGLRVTKLVSGVGSPETGGCWMDDMLAIGPSAPVEMACSVEQFERVFAPEVAAQ